MYELRILYGMEDALGKDVEQEIEKAMMPVAGDDLDKAKTEAEKYAEWHHHYTRYLHAATTNDRIPEWKQRTVNKKKVWEKKFTERPADERPEGRYVILRVQKI